MRPVALIATYLVLGAAGIAGAAWWPTRPAVVFDYPTVVPKAGVDPADWKAGHLDGWKWCVLHIREHTVARDDAELRGFCPPEPNRTMAFLTGYHAARERFDLLVAADGADAARITVLGQLKAKPRLHDLRVVALPP